MTAMDKQSKPMLLQNTIKKEIDQFCKRLPNSSISLKHIIETTTGSRFY
jgi:hypothetical protein